MPIIPPNIVIIADIPVTQNKMLNNILALNPSLSPENFETNINEIFPTIKFSTNIATIQIIGSIFATIINVSKSNLFKLVEIFKISITITVIKQIVPPYNKFSK